MSLVGEATGVFGLLGKAWSLLRDRLDPARAQAKRLIDTFEAYGIARQQIPRLLPPELKLPNATFSTPDKLKDKVTPELLDCVGNRGQTMVSADFHSGNSGLSLLLPRSSSPRPSPLSPEKRQHAYPIALLNRRTARRSVCF